MDASKDVKAEEPVAAAPKKVSKKSVAVPKPAEVAPSAVEPVKVPAVEAPVVVEPPSAPAVEAPVVVEDVVVTTEPTPEVRLAEAVEESRLSLETNVNLAEANQKPWYLSTAVIYALVKNAVVAVPYSQKIFDKTLEALCTATTYINKSTNLNVVLEAEDCTALIAKLDGTVAGQLAKVDDGFDSLREKLGESVGQLKAAVVAHRDWAEQFAASHLSEAGESSASVKASIKTRFETLMAAVRAALDVAREKYPALYSSIASASEDLRDVAASIAEDSRQRATDTVQAGLDAAKSLAADTKSRAEAGLETAKTVAAEQKARAEAKVQAGVDAANAVVTDVKTRASDARASAESTILAAAAHILQTAQPYVQGVVNSEYVASAVELSQPYLAAAKPYTDPLVAKAVEINSTLSDNKVVGAYVTKAEEVAANLIESAKTYCTADVAAEQVEQEEQPNDVAAAAL